MAASGQDGFTKQVKSAKATAREKKRADFWRKKQADIAKGDEEQSTEVDNTIKLVPVTNVRGFVGVKPVSPKKPKKRKKDKLENETDTNTDIKTKKPKKEQLIETLGKIEAWDSDVRKETVSKPNNSGKQEKDSSDIKSEKPPPVKKDKKKPSHDYILFLGNLPFTTTEDDIREHFVRAGHVEAIRLLTDAKTKKARGCGYIEFSNVHDHRRALTYHQTEMKGRKINVEFTSAGRKTDKRMESLKRKNERLAKHKVAAFVNPGIRIS